MTETSSSMVAKIAAMQDYACTATSPGRAASRTTSTDRPEDPQVTRNAFQRAYDMIIRYGTEEYTDVKKKLVRYNFFKDERTTAARTRCSASTSR
jgi:serine protein kinase